MTSFSPVGRFSAATDWPGVDPLPHATIIGGELHYEVCGHGPPIVLAAGLGGLGSFWLPHIDALAPQFTVITYDHRGSGRSSRSPAPYTIEGMTEDALALLDHLDCGSVQFVGHSTGGAIGQRLASRYPARIARLVLSSTWTHCDPYFRRLFTLRRDILAQSDTDVYARLATLLLFPPSWIADNDETIADDGAQMDAGDRAILASKIQALLQFDGRDELSAIRCPTLVVAAEDDITIPSYFARSLAAGIDDSRLSILTTGGHYHPVTRVREFASLIGTFLAVRTGAPRQ
jgi:aminoacrylate hydrolase